MFCKHCDCFPKDNNVLEILVVPKTIQYIGSKVDVLKLMRVKIVQKYRSHEDTKKVLHAALKPHSLSSFKMTADLS